METALAAVWLIKVVVVHDGKTHYGDPDDAKYRSAYATRAACLKAAAPLVAIVRPGPRMFYEVKGVSCREHKIEVR